jgi:hypothetical protein
MEHRQHADLACLPCGFLRVTTTASHPETCEGSTLQSRAAHGSTSGSGLRPLRHGPGIDSSAVLSWEFWGMGRVPDSLARHERHPDIIFLRRDQLLRLAYATYTPSCPIWSRLPQARHCDAARSKLSSTVVGDNNRSPFSDLPEW